VSLSESYWFATLSDKQRCKDEFSWRRRIASTDSIHLSWMQSHQLKAEKLLQLLGVVLADGRVYTVLLM
jgi:hypothetical protein